MTGLRGSLGKLFGGSAVQIEGAPEAELAIAPRTPEEAARVLDFASEHGLKVLPWGSGTHQGLGNRVDPDLIVSTERLAEVIDWQPDDLTIVVEAGVTVGGLDDLLAKRRQSAVLPETGGGATVGGVVATGASGWRRLRYGPTRDRMLEVVAVTGDGRIVRGGARVVKNVTGYDIPRLMTGSLGSLGLITQVCFKLWPSPQSEAMVVVEDLERALSSVYRPLAVLQTPQGSMIYLSGTEQEVEAQGAAIGGEMRAVEWPPRPDTGLVVRIGVAPSLVGDAIERSESVDFVAAHGVGEVVAAIEASPEALEGLREWAESSGGFVAVERSPDALYEQIDAWGTPPPTVGLQRRIKAAFDPVGVMVPGRLPGGI